MGYYLFYLFFAFIICLAYSFSFYLYLLLEFAVKQKKEVPDWFYRIGQNMQDRIHRVKLEDRTNYDGLKRSRFFLLGMLLLSFFTYLFFHSQSHAISSALLNCGKAQFVICFVMKELTQYWNLGSSPKEKRSYYSPSFAVSGCFIISSVLLLLFFSKHGTTTVSHFLSIDLFPKSFSIIATLFGRQEPQRNPHPSQP